ncbi:MAG: UDP-N-acetylglucosamine--N-acetylmuramyl-(pentapeptide) pyrophosphoryl-undecaprenol N-acetylglucosamine transferase [Deltaproteobacteria bacterium]
MRLVIAGGGTGGHLFPALAIAQAARAEDPDGSILFVGTRNGIEARIIPQTEFPIRYILARGMRGTGLMNMLRATSEVPRGIMQSISILRAFKPDQVLGVGGYASGPTLAARIFTSWEHTEPEPPAHKTIVAGNPIRGDLLKNLPPRNERTKFHLLIFGGSQGARSLNQALMENLDKLARSPEQIAIIHQVGLRAAEDVRKTYEKAGFEADVREFIDNMGEAYHWADLVVCRGGASSLAELTALGKPAVIVPYPYAIGNHQAKNASMLESRGAVRVVDEGKLRNGTLAGEVRNLLDNPDVLKTMAENSRKAGRPDAASAIVRELLKPKRSTA